MFFKQMSFYPLNKANLPEIETIVAKLSTAQFAPCMGLDWFTEGFATAVPFDESLAFSTGKSHLVALKKETKVLPGSVIKDALNEKVSRIEKEEGRTVGRKEKMALKEQITDDLLPRAFTKSGRTNALFDYERGYLMVDSASAKNAEAMLSKIRQALGGLEATLPNTEISPSTLMTNWLLAGQAEGQFELDSDCVQRGTGDVAATVRIAKQDLTEEEVTNHAKTGKVVTQLGLVWQERIRFILTDQLSLKRIQFLEVLQDEAGEQGEDLASLTTASQIIMTDNLGALLGELISHLGGLQKP